MTRIVTPVVSFHNLQKAVFIYIQIKETQPEHSGHKTGHLEREKKIEDLGVCL